MVHLYSQLIPYNKYETVPHLLLSGTLYFCSTNATSEHICHFDVIWSIYNCITQMRAYPQENKIRVKKSYKYRNRCARHHIRSLQIKTTNFKLLDFSIFRFRVNLMKVFLETHRAHYI